LLTLTRSFYLIQFLFGWLSFTHTIGQVSLTKSTEKGKSPAKSSAIVTFALEKSALAGFG